VSIKEKARVFAITAHGEQRYGEYPYSFHLDAVAELVEAYGETAQAVAYLHDVVEDTPTTLAEIETHFGASVAAAVEILTDEPGANRKERKAKTYAKMAQVTDANHIALVVKAADRLANVKSCVANNNERLLAVYQSEQETFKASAYRPNLCDELWEAIEQWLSEHDSHSD